MKLHDVFSINKPILGMLHLNGDSADDILKRVIRETEFMTRAGVDAVVVEDYFGDKSDVRRVLEYFRREKTDDIVYGVNVLDEFAISYEMAAEFGASFIQVDSVSGHLPPEEDMAYEKTISSHRENGGILILGGVRFKYQPYLSGRTLEEDIRIGMKRCDVLVVTGNGTGMETSTDKIREFRKIAGDFPLFIGAGVTVKNCAEQMTLGDGVIIGSYFKTDGDVKNEMDQDRVKSFMDEVRRVRELVALQ
jgi:predicted TIM-barrel enzyme